MKQKLNEPKAPGFYPVGFNVFVPIYRETMINMLEEDYEKFNELEDAGKIKGRVSPTNDYLVFYRSDDPETGEFVEQYRLEDTEIVK